MLSRDEVCLFFAFVGVVLIFLVALGSMSIIWCYLTRKPLGMQTLFDRMIKDLILTSVAMMLIGTFHSLRGIPWDPLIAKIVIVANFWATFVNCNQVFNTILIRYLSIFYAPLVYEWNEDLVINRLRIGNIALASYSTFYEVFFRGYGSGRVFGQMIGVPDSEIAPIFSLKLIMTVDLVFLVGAQARIEWYKRQNRLIREIGDIYKIRISAILVALVICLILSILLLFRHRSQTIQNGLSVIIGFTLYDILPVVMILKSPKIKEFLVNKLKP